MQCLIVIIATNGGSAVTGLTRNVVFLAGFLGVAPVLQAQRGKKEPLEFTRQGLLIVNFIPGPGADLRLGRRAADAVRDRVAKLVNKREVEVIDGDDIGRSSSAPATIPTRRSRKARRTRLADFFALTNF